MSPCLQVFEASNWPCNQEIKLQHLINSPAMHGVELYTGLIKKYGPEQVIKGECVKSDLLPLLYKPSYSAPSWHCSCCCGPVTLLQSSSDSS